MDAQIQSRVMQPAHHLPFEVVALVLQGGGALGAYQAGVYEALSEAGIHPNWIAGMSIGAINAAIIAGNAPNDRVDRLREFWTQVTSDGPWPGASNACLDFARGDARGFFKARPVLPWFQPAGTTDATSVYDTSELKRTLERPVDFDRINAAGATRFSVGAVNVRSGNFAYFDNDTHTIRPEHIMASGALPPGFPAVEIEGEHYWDGGLVSNTPLRVVETEPRRDTLAFQVDLWSARGEFPRSIFDVMTRDKEIRYSSRTRAGTDQFKHIQKLRHTLAGLLEKLPEELKNGPEARLLGSVAERKVYNHRPSDLSRQELRGQFQGL